MSSRWVMGILSTDYDLHDYREALINKLKSFNVHVSAFELPEFPVDPEQHSHQSCIKALMRTNVALLIIDKRYGGIYYDSATISITEQEYFTAVEKHIPCLVFVNRNAWNELHAYKIDLKVSGREQAEFDKGYECKYVSNVKTLHFINKISHSYDKQKCSNWISFFDGIPNLLDEVTGKLRGLSQFWLKKLINKQRELLLARKTSTSLSMSLGDVFQKGYYIEPEYTQESGEIVGSKMDLEDLIVANLTDAKSILVYGEAGYGKTTILAKSFLKHVECFNREDGYQMPFYIWLKDKCSDYHFDFSCYIRESFSQHLGLEVYPFLELSDIKPYFYLDGFDELAEEILPTEIKRISNSSIFSFPVMLTSRIQYMLRYLGNYELMNRFSVQIRIKKWDIEKAKQYIDNFCSKKGADQDLNNRIYELLANNSELCDILDSPLLITMLLWVIEAKRMTVPETISTRVQLFQAFLIEMAKREIHRISSQLVEKELILVWSYFAWLVYCKKLLGKQAKIDDIFRMLREELLPEYEITYRPNLFDALFDIVDGKVYGTFHEQFLEFLVANTFYHASCEKREPYPEFLRYVVRPEINRYFRAMWNEGCEEDRERIVSNIYGQYLDKAGSDNNVDIAVRVHAIYHVSRLDSIAREENLKRAFNIETHISVRLSLFFGAIKMGQLDKEDEFYQLLLNDDDYNIANRGYHLAYYDKPNFGDMPFKDEGGDWPNTLNAFLKHFRSKRREQYFLRRIDLITLYQLMESRCSVKPVTRENIEELENLISHPPVSDQPEFQKKTEETFGMVKKKFEELCSKTD